MALKIDNKWVWDFWFTVDGPDYHIFYLQADKSLGDPDLRHWNVSIGHAVSQDLLKWCVVRDAIAPSLDQNAADSCTTWTGCIYRNGSAWYMYYTGTSHAEDGLVQRICLAKSYDLLFWQKCEENPVVELNETWYDGLNKELWHDASWRDPWVFKDPSEETYHMLITCRSNSGRPDGRGAIGRAISHDLKKWTVTAPLLSPGWYGEMEVPQLEKIGEYYYLFCSVSTKYHSDLRRSSMQDTPFTGVQYFVAKNPMGPFSCFEDGRLIGDENGKIYSGRVVQGPDDHWYLMGFHNVDDSGQFLGYISDPMRIYVGSDGRLSLESMSTMEESI